MIDRHAAMITKYECHGCNPKLCRSSMTVEVDFADPRSGRRWCARRGDWACAARVYFSPVWVCTPACRHRDWARGIVSPTVHETECDIRLHSSFGHARRIEPRVRVFGATAAYRSVRTSLVRWTSNAVDLLDRGCLATAARTDRWSYGPRSASVARTAWILARAARQPEVRTRAGWHAAGERQREGNSACCVNSKRMSTARKLLLSCRVGRWIWTDQQTADQKNDPASQWCAREDSSVGENIARTSDVPSSRTAREKCRWIVRPVRRSRSRSSPSGNEVFVGGVGARGCVVAIGAHRSACHTGWHRDNADSVRFAENARNSRVDYLQLWRWVWSPLGRKRTVCSPHRPRRTCARKGFASWASSEGADRAPTSENSTGVLTNVAVTRTPSTAWRTTVKARR